MTLAIWLTVAALGLMTIVLIVMRKKGREDEARGEWTLEFALNLAIAIYLLVLAYGVVLGRDAIDAARQDVEVEAQSLVEIYWDVAAIPDSRPIRDTIRRYTTESIEKDWPLMAEGRMSAAAADTLNDLRVQLQRLRPEDEAERSRQEDALSRLTELGQSRQVRASDAGTYLPDVFLVVMVISGVAVIVFPWLQGYKPNVSSIAADITRVVTVIAGCGFLVIVSHPFSGPAPVDTGPLTEAQHTFDVIDQKIS